MKTKNTVGLILMKIVKIVLIFMSMSNLSNLTNGEIDQYNTMDTTSEHLIKFLKTFFSHHTLDRCPAPSVSDVTVLMSLRIQADARLRQQVM